MLRIELISNSSVKCFVLVWIHRYQWMIFLKRFARLRKSVSILAWIWLFVSLFVCLGFIVLFENFTLIWRRPHYRWKVANFDLSSALIAIEQLGFLNSVPHLLWHGASVYNGHLRGPVTLIPVAERLVVDLSLKICFYDLGLSRLGFENRIRGQRSDPLRHRRLNMIHI